MKVEIAKFQDGYYYVVDGVKQNRVDNINVVNERKEPKPFPTAEELRGHWLFGLTVAKIEELQRKYPHLDFF